MPGRPGVDEQIAEYYQAMDDLTQAAVNGRINEKQFKDEAERLTIAALILLYLLGGGDPAKQDRALAPKIKINKRSIGLLSDDIYSGRYSANEKQTEADGKRKLLTRLVMWGVAIYGAYNLGRTWQLPKLDYETGVLAEPAEEWRRGPTKEGCHTCTTLDGVGLTVSDWRYLASAGIEPQSPDLDCHGYYCLCGLYPTDILPVDVSSVLRSLQV